MNEAMISLMSCFVMPIIVVLLVGMIVLLVVILYNSAKIMQTLNISTIGIVIGLVLVACLVLSALGTIFL